MSKIVAQVAEILDNRTLVLNKGKKQWIATNMIFQIIDKEGKDIVDPASGKKLGTLKRPKIKVKVTYVDENYSLAETYQYKEVNVGGTNSFASISKVIAPPKYIKEYDTFEIEENVKREIDKEKSLVKIGDSAELIEEDK